MMRTGTFSLLPLTTAVATAVVLLCLGAALQHAVDRVPAGHGPSRWDASLAQVDRALADGDIRRASTAWRDAYAAARASHRWEGMIAVGDAYLRIADAAGERAVAVPKARESYLIAMFSARRVGAIDGVLRSSDAFAALGDRDLAARAARVAQHMAETRSVVAAYGADR